jgi:hypothetical protein
MTLVRREVTYSGSAERRDLTGRAYRRGPA